MSYKTQTQITKFPTVLFKVDEWLHHYPKFHKRYCQRFCDYVDNRVLAWANDERNWGRAYKVKQ